MSGRRTTKRVDYRQLAEYGYDDGATEEDKGGEDTVGQDALPIPAATDTTIIPADASHNATPPLSVKRRRGRPRKHPRPTSPLPEGADPGFPPDTLGTSLAPLAAYTCPEPPTPARDAINIPESSTGGVASDGEDALDLLESCLKESGIKAVDGDIQGRKSKSNPDLKTIIEVKEEEEEVEEDEEEDEEDEEEEVDMVGTKCGVKIEEEDEYDGFPGREVDEVYVCDSVEAVNSIPKKSNIKSQYKCDECGKMYSTLSILKSHKIRHRDKKDLPFHCDKCDFTAASKIELFRHSYKHSDSQLYICEICGNTFSRDTSLREHIEYVHSTTRKLKCGQCGYVTNRRQTMRKHLLSHNEVRPVIACPICGVTFKCKRNLKTHLFSHVGAKPFECDECGKKFILKNRLVVHKQQVHGPRTHKCPECAKSFPTYHHLQRHVRIHTGEKPYKCCFCAFTCNTQGNLIKHIRQIHEKVSFSYKDCLRVSHNTPKTEPVGDGELQRLSEEGREVAQRLLPTLEEYTGQPLSLDQLAQQVKREKEAKEQSVQEQLSRKKKRAQRKPVGGPKPMPSNTLCSGGEEGKVTLYAVSGGAGGGGSSMENLMDDQVYVEDGLGHLGESQYLLTQPDDGGCVMIIPWDVSLIGEEDAGWGGERRAASGEGEVMTIRVPKEELGGGIGGFESALELTTRTKGVRLKEASEEGAEVIGGQGVVGGLSRDLGGKSKHPSMASAKAREKSFPESIQIIASNEPVDDPPHYASSLVLPEGYIFDSTGQVIQLPEGVLDANLLLRQAVRGQEAPEVTINKITSNVYSLMSQGSHGSDGETYVITTQEGEDEDEEAERSTEQQGSVARMETASGKVDLLPGEEEEDRQSALVLIVNADDIDN